MVASREEAVRSREGFVRNPFSFSRQIPKPERYSRSVIFSGKIVDKLLAPAYISRVNHSDSRPLTSLPYAGPRPTQEHGKVLVEAKHAPNSGGADETVRFAVTTQVDCVHPHWTATTLATLAS